MPSHTKHTPSKMSITVIHICKVYLSSPFHSKRFLLQTVRFSYNFCQTYHENITIVISYQHEIFCDALLRVIKL